MRVLRYIANIMKNILVWSIGILAVGMMIFTIISVNTFDQTQRNLFGYKALIVLSDSMSATDFDAGDLILVKDVDPTTLQEGDIIAYTSTNSNNYGETVTHKIREITTHENGEPGFITYGTTTDTDDENIVTYEYVLGKYIKAIPNIGEFFQFLKTTPGYLICIFIPFMLLILSQVLNTITLFKKYKNEQKAELQAEREQIAAEVAESQRLKEELLKLKEELGVENGSNHIKVDTPTT